MKGKILFVIPGLGNGGTETALLRLCEGLQHRGWMIRVVTLGHARTLEPRFLDLGIPVHGGSLERRFSWAPPGLGTLLRGILGMFIVWFFLCRWRPTLVHAFLPQGVISAGLARIACCPGIPLVASRRSLRNYQDKHRFLAKLEIFVMRRAAMLTANSQAVENDLISEGLPKVRIKRIYNGCPHPQGSAVSRAELREKHGIAPGEVAMLIVANLFPYKGHEDLLRALAIVNRNPEQVEWRLLCVGRDLGLLPSLREIAEEEGIDSRVKWIGAVEDPGEYYQSVDLALLVSHEEGFSNAILEAMAARLPVIATNVGGNAESVVDGETGILVPVGDPESLAAAIVTLVGDAELRSKMGTAGEARQKSEFSMQQCEEKHEEMYLEVTASPVQR